MVRDSLCLYAYWDYWDYNEKQYSAFVKRYLYKKSCWIIRLYNKTLFNGTPTDTCTHTDIPVAIHTCGTYIGLSRDNFSCSAGVGYSNGQGIFHMFIQSNTIVIPFTAQSNAILPVVPVLTAVSGCAVTISASPLLQRYSSGCRKG